MKKKNGVKIIQTAGYNGACTVYPLSISFKTIPIAKAFMYEMSEKLNNKIEWNSWNSKIILAVKNGQLF